jgi:hypothetical protein
MGILFCKLVGETNEMWSLSTDGLCLQVVLSTGLTVLTMLSCFRVLNLRKDLTF